VPVCQPAGGQGRKVGVGLTAEKMRECKWLVPELVGQFEFLELTPDNHLRHSRFIGRREDKKAKEVMRNDRE
jgi:ATP-dependent DNA ligase